MQNCIITVSAGTTRTRHLDDKRSFAGDLNVYRMVGNNPMLAVDIYGLNDLGIGGTLVVVGGVTIAAVAMALVIVPATGVIIVTSMGVIVVGGIVSAVEYVIKNKDCSNTSEEPEFPSTQPIYLPDSLNTIASVQFQI